MASAASRSLAGRVERRRGRQGQRRTRARPDRHVLAAWQRAERDRKWVLIGVLIAWELVMRLGLIGSLFFAAPSEVAVALVELVQDPQVRDAVMAAGLMFLSALAVAIVTGVLAGALLGLSEIAYRALHPMVVVFFATPSMIFIPLVILLLGTGFEAKVAYAALSGFSPIVVTVTAGARSVDPKLMQSARSMGMSRLQTIRLVLVPGSLPSVFAALGYGIKHCLLGVLIMELFVSQRGIGYLLRSYTSSFRMDRVLVLALAVSLLAISLSALWKRVERRAMRWQPSE